MRRPGLRWGVFAASGLAILALCGSAGLAEQAAREAHKQLFLGRLADLKGDFARKAGQTDNPEEILAITALYAGQVWEQAARRLHEKYQRPEVGKIITQMERDYQREIGRTRPDPIHRQILGLRILHQSLGAVNLTLALKNGDRHALRQVREVQKRLAETHKQETKEDVFALVALSQGVANMMALTVRLADSGHRVMGPVSEELVRQAAEAERIREREDIHHYAKLFLWTVNNLNSAFTLTCLLGEAISPELGQAAQTVRAAWSEQIEENGRQPVRAMVISMTGLTEVSFPVVMAFCLM